MLPVVVLVADEDDEDDDDDDDDSPDVAEGIVKTKGTSRTSERRSIVGTIPKFATTTKKKSFQSVLWTKKKEEKKEKKKRTFKSRRLSLVLTNPQRTSPLLLQQHLNNISCCPCGKISRERNEQR